MELKFKTWFEATQRTGASQLYPANYYNGQVPDLYETPRSADAGRETSQMGFDTSDAEDNPLIFVGDAFEGEWTAEPTKGSYHDFAQGHTHKPHLNPQNVQMMANWKDIEPCSNKPPRKKVFKNYYTIPAWL